MCSIIGFKAGTKDKHENKIEEYLKVLQERGDQSFGYFYRTLDGETYFNKSLSIKPLIEQIEATPKGAWCFMHARKASLGMTGGNATLQLARAHPVESDDKLITLIHNGTKSPIYDTVQGSISDSQGLATLLSVAWEGRREYYGDVGVVLYEKAGDVYLYKDGSRPLVMSEDNTIFASEPIFDNMKWKNIANTYTNAKGTDTKLKMKQDGLGLTFGKLVDINFDIATTTVYNFSTKGMPKTTLCGICKKTHIKENGGFTCCVCKIEGRRAIKTVTTASSVSYNKNANKTKGGVGEIKSLPAGIAELSNWKVTPTGKIDMYVSDFNLFKEAGHPKGIAYVGFAIVRADYIYQTLDGTMIIKPKADGKFLVKVDKIHVDSTLANVTTVYSAASKETVKLIGQYGKALTILKDLNLAFANHNPTEGVTPLIVEIKNDGVLKKKVGFPLLTNTQQYKK